MRSAASQQFCLFETNVTFTGQNHTRARKQILMNFSLLFKLRLACRIARMHDCTIARLRQTFGVDCISYIISLLSRMFPIEKCGHN
jgi:hypothetical protein